MGYIFIFGFLCMELYIQIYEFLCNIQSYTTDVALNHRLASARTVRAACQRGAGVRRAAAAYCVP